jgi:hypothetical protein
MDTAASRRGWFDHLTAEDLSVLRRVASRAGVNASDLRTDPVALTAVLSHPAAFDAVFAEDGGDTWVRTSPFLTFALVVHRGWIEVQTARHIDEWVGARQRLPVLGDAGIRAFLDGSHRRLFLTELLASYTRVASGSTWVHSGRGWRRRKFSELDPVRLASLLEVFPEEDHAGVYRRLGDLALFLTGVFPDHTELNGIGSLDEQRLLRLSGLRSEPGTTGAVATLERLGERWYRLAVRTAHGPLTGTMPVVAEVAQGFSVARRALNYLTDRHLFVHRSTWFGAAPG